MPILGIIASQDYPRITNSYESIQTVTVGGGGAANIEFTSIPSTFKHLQIRGITRCTKADTGSENVVVALNSDSTYTNYRTHYLDGDGTGVSAGAIQVSAFYSNAGLTIGNNATANVFSATIIDILDYTNTNKNTTVRVLTGIDTNGYGQVRLASSLWLNTSAVNALTFNPRSAGNFAQYSSFALYGIRG
jgi:hypothetical protein